MVHPHHPHRPTTWSIRLLVVVLAAVLCTLVGASASLARPCWPPPVDGVVVDPFRQPACVWCPGNRGLDYHVGNDVEVHAAASGRVEFAGTVVGVGYLVIRLPSGWRHTYGQLTSIRLDVGDAVLTGGAVGRASGTFFFSVRVGDDYIDPAPYIGALRTRPRLVPVDATPARPAPPARPYCGPREPGADRGVGTRKHADSIV